MTDPVQSTNDSARMEKEKERRDQARLVAEKQISIREFKVAQRLRYIWLASSIAVAALLGWATLVGLWRSYPMPFSYIGLFIGLASTSAAVWLILRSRPDLGQMEHELGVEETKYLHLVAEAEIDAKGALRVYRAGSRTDIEEYRRLAAGNRRVHNLFQWIIIVGSIAVTSITSASIEDKWYSWIGVVTAALVSVSAGLTGYFKYRERSFNQQQTADAIEKEYRAVELTIGDYDTDETTALKAFAKKVEDLKEEQRKRELQLEQSSAPTDHGSK
ncbi:DUF4231 domain-containing protein [Actinosynnema sp. NPDC050801]|uniref:DUF4231 domain-containing protein n=1 Tax=unclassified Actinosynnema TaxID=2637065 RepID=UPI003403889D